MPRLPALPRIISTSSSALSSPPFWCCTRTVVSAGRQPVGERHVVIAGHRDILRTAQAMPAQRRDGADREPVVGADQRGERLAAREQFLGAALAFGFVEGVGEDGVRLRLADAEQLAVQRRTRGSADTRSRAPAARRSRRWAMAAGDQMREDAAYPVLLVVHHRRDTCDRRSRARPSRPACPGAAPAPARRARRSRGSAHRRRAPASSRRCAAGAARRRRCWRGSPHSRAPRARPRCRG